MNNEINDALIRRTGGLQYYAIERIKRQDPLERDKSNKNQTLKIFLEAGMSRKEHSEWRDLYMHWHMQWYASAHWRKVNRYLIEEEEANAGNQANDFIRQPDKLKGWRNSSLSLKELELIAAEEYVKNKNRKQRPLITKAQTSPEDNGAEDMSYTEMKRHLKERTNGIDDGAIQQQTRRALQKALDEERELPMQMSGCVDEYAINKIHKPANPHQKVTVKDCRYIFLKKEQEHKAKKNS